MVNSFKKMSAVLLASAAALALTAFDLGGGLKDSRDGKSAKFWSSTEVGRNANYVFMKFDSGVAIVDLYAPKDKFAHSVRCIKD